MDKVQMSCVYSQRQTIIIILPQVVLVLIRSRYISPYDPQMKVICLKSQEEINHSKYISCVHPSNC